MLDVIPPDERTPGGGAGVSPEPFASSDPTAALRVLRRLEGQTSRPWLHEEVSRRMVDRLQWLKTPPGSALLWWPSWAAGAGHLNSALPGLVCAAVEARPMPPLQPPTPWASLWRRWAKSSLPHEVDPWMMAASGEGMAGDTPAVQKAQAASAAARGVDLVWAPWVLHMHPAPSAVLRHWWSRLHPGGVLMFSCLGPGSLQGLRRLYEALNWPLPAPPYVDMHDWGDQLLSLGFSDPVLDQETLTLHWQDAGALLRDLRAWGGNTARARFQGLRTPGWRQRLVEAIQSGLGDAGRLSLQIEVIYGQAFKPEALMPMKPETRLGLSEMREMLRRGRKTA
jgi:malonyl-CoA O-methyltransferase